MRSSEISKCCFVWADMRQTSPSALPIQLTESFSCEIDTSCSSNDCSISPSWRLWFCSLQAMRIIVKKNDRTTLLHVFSVSLHHLFVQRNVLLGYKGSWVSFLLHCSCFMICFGLASKSNYSASCLANSHTTIPAVTLTFSECLVPNCGISKQLSLAFTTACSTPFTSFPNTTA